MHCRALRVYQRLYVVLMYVQQCKQATKGFDVETLVFCAYMLDQDGCMHEPELASVVLNSK